MARHIRFVSQGMLMLPGLSRGLPRPVPLGTRRSVQGARTTAASASQLETEEATTSGIDWEAFQEHQRAAARLSNADEARLLLDTGRTGVICTLGSFGALTGFPMGSVVEYATDERGRPVFAFSSLSGHTSDVRADPRCSLTVTAAGFSGMSDARVTLSGHLSVLEGDDMAAARTAYKAKNPGSFWVDFGDFSWFRMDKILTARLVGGFARAHQVSAQEYEASTTDPVAAFVTPIASHMNADHADSIIAMLKHYAGIPVQQAAITGLDRLGLDLKCVADGQSFKTRLPFVRPAESRKDVKDVIVEMTRAAAAALQN